MSRRASTRPLATQNSLLAVGVEQDLPIRVSDCRGRPKVEILEKGDLEP